MANDCGPSTESTISHVIVVPASRYQGDIFGKACHVPMVYVREGNL